MTLKRFLASAAAALSLGTGACASVDTPPPGAVPGPALWQVADKDTTIYLFGTVHRLPESAAWYDGRISHAFESADELVTEIDLSDQAAVARTLAAAGTLPAGQNLRELLTPESRQKYEAALVSLGLPIETLDAYKPWYAAVLLSLIPLAKAGYEPDKGPDAALTARAGGKGRASLETIDQQIAFFNELSLEEQLAFFDSSVASNADVAGVLDTIVAEWAEGDVAALQQYLLTTDPLFRERLLAARNVKWAEWIDNRLDRPGTVFVAVGAGHLAGEGSVQDQLRRRRVKVTRVWQ
jgi:uncharacterized protein